MDQILRLRMAIESADPTAVARGIESLLDSSLGKQSDTEAIVYAVTCLDELTQRLLRCEGRTKGGGFVKSVRLCETLGLIEPELAADLKVIADVRNTFAHELGVSFASEAITRLLDGLQRMGQPLPSHPHSPPVEVANRLRCFQAAWALAIYLAQEIDSRPKSKAD